MKYNHKKIEKKWQEKWAEQGLYQPNLKKAENPFYNLMMFPYPSGEGLHVGHAYAYSGSDTYGRFKRMRGFNIFEPMGFDAFGIHSENYAIQVGKHPQQLTKETTNRYKKQLKKAGLGLDWSHEVNTTKPSYYQWTQWLFLQLYKNGLAERKKAPVNWCPSCKTVLADEQVIQGHCERCDCIVEQRELKQWFLKITDYAEKLDKNLDKIDWSENVKKLQRNWIGKSEGTEIKFNVKCQMSNVKCSAIKVFTTRPDTLFGATFMVLAPEHKLAKQVAEENSEVREYIKKARQKTEQERIEKEKTGVDTGLKAVNPATEEEVPIWVADFVLAHYGGGAVMGVPAHDQRDFDFAHHNNLPIRQVVVPKNSNRKALLIHGLGGSGEDIWKPWFKDKLEKLGFEVFSPTLSHAEHPDLEKILEELNPYLKQLTEESIIVGHSLGGPIALHALSKINTNIKAVILVASPTPGIDQGYQDIDLEELKESFSEEVLNAAGEIVKAEIDWKSIKKKAQNHIAFFSDDDPYIPLKSKDEFPDFWETKVLEKREHFNQETFPELLEFINALYCYQGEGFLVNSSQFNGMDSEQAKEKITKEFGKKAVTYRLRDWLISRQRYWGPPIPIIYCDKCGEVPVPEQDLPVKLPYMKDFQPTGTEKAPLAHNEEFVNTKCPQCGGPAKRETDVSDNFLDSAWYFLRYTSTDFDDRAFDEQLTKKWLPVDMYIGGPEHACLHLMYTRFITMALHDLGFIEFKEPFKKFRAHGIITKGGFKMSKSRGNVVNPDQYINDYGADCFRMYLLFLGPFNQGGDFSEQGISGIERFLNKVWSLAINSEPADPNDQNSEIERKLHQTIKKVTEDIENLKFNTAIAAMMEYLNVIKNYPRTTAVPPGVHGKAAGSPKSRGAAGQSKFQIPKKYLEPLVKMLAPFAPHLTEEIWREVWKNQESIFNQQWPEYIEKLAKPEQITLVVQINGKVRDQLKAEPGISKKEAEDLALKSKKVQKWLKDKQIKRTIFVENKLINFVAK